MAWILAGVGAVIGVSYIYDVVSDAVKPFYDYIEKEEKDAEQRILEEIRQEDIERKKTGHKNRDMIREKYHIKDRKITRIINNTEEVCTIIFVNHHHAKNEEAAISWSKHYNYFDGQVMNKMNTKKEILGVSNTYELIDRELNDYYIVIKCTDKFSVLEKGNKGNITVSSLFEIKQEAVDLSCKWQVF